MIMLIQAQLCLWYVAVQSVMDNATETSEIG